jgi:4-hydroxybenzoate polyprenyltransferase
MSRNPAAASLPKLGTTAPFSLARKLRALAADIKLHHSIFALPWAVLATFLAASRTPGGLRLGQLCLILLAMVFARTFAMAANRLVDAETDAKNPRTARRAIPSGQLSATFVAIATIACGVAFVTVAGGFWICYSNPWPLALSVVVLAFLAGYPFLKRFTRLSHYYLGAALALAPVCAWIAIAGHLAAPPLYMAAAVLLWTAGFDILYACQDYAFDVAHGLFSVPATLGIAPALRVARCTHAAALAFIILLGITTPQLHTLYWIGASAAAVLLIVEHALVGPTDLSKLGLAFFTINGIISLLLGTLGTLDVVIRR